MQGDDASAAIESVTPFPDWDGDTSLAEPLRVELGKGSATLETREIELNGARYWLKFCRSRKHWVHETAMLTRLAGNCAPKLLLPAVAATAEAAWHILLLEPAGSELTSEQWLDCEVHRHILDALITLHALGVVNGDLKPKHIRMGPDGNIKILDWDCASFRTTDYGALVPPAFAKSTDSQDKYLKQLPHHLFWGAFAGTGLFAPWSQHFGYGPSVLGDLESYAYVVLYKLAGNRLPWDGASSSRSMGEHKFLLVHNLLQPGEAPNHVKQDCWDRLWGLLRELAVDIRSSKEEGAALRLASFIMQELLGSPEPCEWPVLVSSFVEPHAANKPGTTAGGSESAPEHPGPPPPSVHLRQDAHLRSQSAQLGRQAEHGVRELLTRCFGVEVHSRHGFMTHPFFQTLRAMHPGKDGLPCAEVEVGFVAEVPCKSIRKLLVKDKDRKVDMKAIDASTPPKGGIFQGTGQPSVTFVAECIASTHASRIRDKLSQLEIALFYMGMHHPGQLMTPPLLGAVVYIGTNDLCFSITDANWETLPRCHALFLRGLLCAIRVGDQELLKLVAQMRSAAAAAEAETSTTRQARLEQEVAAMAQQRDVDRALAEARIVQLQEDVRLAQVTAKADADARIAELEQRMEQRMLEFMSQMAAKQG